MSRIISAHKVSEIISNISKDIKPEEVMADKIQMTEEQARKFFADIFWDYFDSESETLTALNTAKEKGYIIKSELQQKVEEAKRMWDTKTYWTPLEHIQREAIELLEQSHPEFKEK